MQVLEGGRLTIAAHRPTILIEGPKELWERMKEIGRASCRERV